MRYITQALRAALAPSSLTAAIKVIAASAASVALLAACATSPLGRNQLILTSEAEMSQMGAAAFQELKQKQKVSNNRRVNQYVSCVTLAVTRALPERRAWEVVVFEDDSANAFALPGGKIGVHTGLLKVAENQDQLATVIGHEIAHVTARHSAERVSTSQLASTGLQVTQVLLGDPTPAKQQLMGLLGVGAQVGVLLPFGRTQESEADLLGLDYMAKAGFDPRASVRLWQNMERAKGGNSPPEFLSTHPSGNTRISKLNKRIPSAMPLYQQAQSQGRNPRCDA